jgi:hypothetical protein
MEFAQVLVTPLVLVFIGIRGAYLLKERLDRVEGRIDALPTRDEINARFASNDGRLDRLESEVAALRSDLTQVALAVGARPRPQTG